MDWSFCVWDQLACSDHFDAIRDVVNTCVAQTDARKRYRSFSNNVPNVNTHLKRHLQGNESRFYSQSNLQGVCKERINNQKLKINSFI
ncbi:hypothetical protein TcasGA2_TC006140 [Tribolium castaneum]|uniref:Uncharacterized protein n=1 Tax=Tribolium castaneum TaxID=7070 RepID=D6WUL2_TRICA|nr:hypothetical protein TcasGA2_TC006140 [Tribolium castaneum]